MCAGLKALWLCRSSLQSHAHTASDAHAQDTASTSSTESIGASMANRFQALQSSTASGSVSSETEAAASPSEGGSDHDADMEFARKLQEEEDRIHYERMLQMAGIGIAPQCVLADAAQSTAFTCTNPRQTAFAWMSVLLQVYGKTCHQFSEQTLVHCNQPVSV